MAQNTRILSEIHKLYQKKFKVEIIKNDPRHLKIIVKGPEESAYADGTFLINVQIPDDYPFKSPSIGFETKIFHPNIDENSGTICLDVINQVWSPMYELINVVEIFIPQLLLYPNAHDPLNGEAANQWLNNRNLFNETVKKYIKENCVFEEVKKLVVEDEIDSDDMDI